MKLRGALGGLNLLIEASDTPEMVTEGLAARAEMLTQKVTIELAADADVGVLEAAFAAVRSAGGELGRVRGARENGAKVISEVPDVIGMGALRGVVHAGAGGRTDAIVYARPIASAQIRIADALARSADDNSLGAMRRMQERPEAELARLQDGVIQIESYQPQRS